MFFHKLGDRMPPDYYAAVQWLEDCGLVHVCRRCSEPTGFLAGHIDLKNYNSFKVFPLDVGLRMAACGCPMDFFSQAEGVSGGALRGKAVEQYAFQQLLAVSMDAGIPGPAYYVWQEKGKGGGKYEMDFMLADGGETIPVEVKGSASFRSESMDRFRTRFQPARMLRLSPRGPVIAPPLWSLPLAGAPSAFDFVKLEGIPDPRVNSVQSAPAQDEESCGPRP